MKIARIRAGPRRAAFRTAAGSRVGGTAGRPGSEIRAGGVMALTAFLYREAVPPPFGDSLRERRNLTQAFCRFPSLVSNTSRKRDPGEDTPSYRPLSTVAQAARMGPGGLAYCPLTEAA